MSPCRACGEYDETHYVVTAGGGHERKPACSWCLVAVVSAALTLYGCAVTVQRGRAK